MIYENRQRLVERWHRLRLKERGEDIAKIGQKMGKSCISKSCPPLKIPEIDNSDGSFFALKVDKTPINVGPQTCVEIKREPRNLHWMDFWTDERRVKLRSTSNGFSCGFPFSKFQDEVGPSGADNTSLKIGGDGWDGCVCLPYEFTVHIPDGDGHPMLMRRGSHRQSRKRT